MNVTEIVVPVLDWDEEENSRVLAAWERDLVAELKILKARLRYVQDCRKMGTSPLSLVVNNA